MNTTARAFADKLYEDCSRYAQDIYPGVYTKERCNELGEMWAEMKPIITAEGITLLSHYYPGPENHEAAHFIGDSLALSNFAKTARAKRVQFMAVRFMADTAKIITGNNTRVFVSGSSQELGCSLVFGTDHAAIQSWKRNNPKGTIVSYINSDVFLKSMSDYISTSRNTDKIIAKAIKENPGQPILITPDKYLGDVMKIRALELLEQEGIVIDEDLIQVYRNKFNGFDACCIVHVQFGPDAIERAREMYPNAILLVHPECGCSAQCIYKMKRREIPEGEALILSTEQMIKIAQESAIKEFVVATEPGHLVALRKAVPDKIFYPLSATAHCPYMKANSFEKLLHSLKNNVIEIIICEDDCQECIDPRHPYEDARIAHIPHRLAELAKQGIDRMLAIQ